MKRRLLALKNTFASANWKYFSAVYSMSLLGVGSLLVMLEYLLQRGLDSSGIIAGIAVFVVAVQLAGQRYMKSRHNNWSREDRHQLALVYVGLSFLISAVAVTIMEVVVTFLGGHSSWAAYLNHPTFWVIVPIAFGGVFAVYYGAARWTLGSVERTAASRRRGFV
ncbi:MAG: ABZJ_00895 family protein [Caulobacteraceae bacterium]